MTSPISCPEKRISTIDCDFNTAVREVYAPVEYFRIRRRGCAEKVFIVGADGEKRGINSVKNCGESDELISAEIEFDGYGFLVKTCNSIFDGFNRGIYYNHISIFAN